MPIGYCDTSLSQAKVPDLRSYCDQRLLDVVPTGLSGPIKTDYIAAIYIYDMGFSALDHGRAVVIRLCAFVSWYLRHSVPVMKDIARQYFGIQSTGRYKGNICDVVLQQLLRGDALAQIPEFEDMHRRAYETHIANATANVSTQTNHLRRQQTTSKQPPQGPQQRSGSRRANRGVQSEEETYSQQQERDAPRSRGQPCQPRDPRPYRGVPGCRSPSPVINAQASPQKAPSASAQTSLYPKLPSLSDFHSPSTSQPQQQTSEIRATEGQSSDSRIARERTKAVKVRRIASQLRLFADAIEQSPTHAPFLAVDLFKFAEDLTSLSSQE